MVFLYLWQRNHHIIAFHQSKHQHEPPGISANAMSSGWLCIELYMGAILLSVEEDHPQAKVNGKPRERMRYELNHRRCSSIACLSWKKTQRLSDNLTTLTRLIALLHTYRRQVGRDVGTRQAQLLERLRVLFQVVPDSCQLRAL